jgi:hypothetical protein
MADFWLALRLPLSIIQEKATSIETLLHLLKRFRVILLDVSLLDKLFKGLR